LKVTTNGLTSAPDRSIPPAVGQYATAVGRRLSFSEGGGQKQAGDRGTGEIPLRDHVNVQSIS
jgi:hypothetical protein